MTDLLDIMVLVASRFDSFDLSEEEWPPPSVSDFGPVREALLAVPHTHTVALGLCAVEMTFRH